MCTHSCLVFTGLVLAGVTAGPARADVSWSGPGWYVEATESGFDATLVSGPYADEDRCNAARPADTDDYSYYCDYEGTDPSVVNPPGIGLSQQRR